MSSEEQAAALLAILDAKIMIQNLEYEKAKAKIQEAINHLPTIQYGQEMITLCEILQICQTHKKYSRGKTWPYTVLQIPTSSTKSEVESRYEKLRDHLTTLRLSHKIRGTAAATKELESAMSMYKENYPNLDKKRKAPSPSSEDANKTIDEENAAADDSDNSGDGDDDLLAARSSEFKKLRKRIFTSLPQRPHFSPLAKYCASVRQEMRLGFDMIFVKLTQKLQNLGDDKILSRDGEYTIRAELSNLEEMGYDVMKLRARFDLWLRVKTFAKEDQSYEEKLKNLEGKIKAEMVQLEKVQCRISDLKSEKEVVKSKHYSFKSEMASLKSKLSKEDLVKTEVED